MFKNCTLNTVGHPFGRGANIFVTQAMNGDSPVRVIKEQWVRSTIRGTEKEILDTIHQGSVYGTDWIFWLRPDIGTPRKMLYALYDLLEGEPRRMPALTWTSNHI